MTMEKGMRDKDVRRVASLVQYHMEHPQTEPVRGYKSSWSLIRFAAWAIPILMHHGYIGAGEPEEKVACKGVGYREVG